MPTTDHPDRTRPTTRSRGLRRLSALTITVLGLLSLAFGPTVASSGHQHGDHQHVNDPRGDHQRDLGEVAGGAVGRLAEAPQALFWQTPYVECEGTDDDAANLSGPPSCADTAFTWTVALTRSAPLLRVDFDYPYRQDDHTLTVTRPDGTAVSQASANTYSHGVVIQDATRGSYEIELRVQRTAGSIVRLRAGLVAPERTAGALLPNLRVTPPFEVGFAAPVNPANSLFLADDDQNPAVAVGGDPLYSCTPDEVQEVADPTRSEQPTLLTECLRFTAGPHNVGEGPFDVRFPIADRAVADRDRLYEMTQHVHQSDGTTTERDAGTYEYHATHGHYHYADILFYELYRADPVSGQVVAAGVGHKSGFCPGDQGYGDWRSFRQGTINALGYSEATGENCFATTGNGALGLSTGWGDFYRWQRPGQFVDFSGQGDGHYVIRATVDVLGNVVESDESDNTSYAYVRITGDQVELLERGYGLDPWDPAKVLAEDNRGQRPLRGLVD